MVNYLRKTGDFMETALIVISIILIVLVLLQSSKAQDGGQIISGGNAELFMNVKERGSELFLSRLTLVLGLAFFIISLILYLQ
ncbi:MAG: preprotein translocase subunit SecG [Bacilli bacterium]|nr:preprotein translocase subunit SecG [Bacilli bacterium]